ncbi:MAG: Lrp/AsnC ligand binding domain-containing protein [Candidatus Nezhaarchaeota archaeon]|nr:Lrp/AsnC ligand binding domain-containing protein [Candidatus Nezhaarchaeota archaeon]MCX8141358.1 Lrp/AsnC ligand binding domain-containing protein [Candidatus Nezhaarchaeota archaeon]MDW8049624.1 Lrp/AsnC ligand binding domain-containing protein [Nitrososphaerota archaeon]
MHVVFVLINTKPGKAFEVAEKVCKIEKVKAAHAVTGPYDVIAYFESEEPIADVRKIVSKIHEVEGVERTLTAIAIH